MVRPPLLAPPTPPRGHTDAVLCLQFDGEKLVSGSKDMSIKVWSLATGQCRLTLHGHEGAVTCLQFDTKRIVSGALDRVIKIWDIVTGEVRRLCASPACQAGAGSCFIWTVVLATLLLIYIFVYTKCLICIVHGQPTAHVVRDSEMSLSLRSATTLLCGGVHTTMGPQRHMLANVIHLLLASTTAQLHTLDAVLLHVQCIQCVYIPVCTTGTECES